MNEKTIGSYILIIRWLVSFVLDNYNLRCLIQNNKCIKK